MKAVLKIITTTNSFCSALRRDSCLLLQLNGSYTKRSSPMAAIIRPGF